jgi:peroxiredoxin Q/BCP
LLWKRFTLKAYSEGLTVLRELRANRKILMAKDLKPGDRAPLFNLPADGGAAVSLSALKGKTIVVYFYPKDDTTGCTLEAIDFTKTAKAFKAADAIVIGVSKDNVTSHDKFKTKHKLGITLASDEETSTAQAYGVWVKKSMYGREYMGTERATFLIDGKGVIRKIWRKVKVPGHVAEVLGSVKAL